MTDRELMQQALDALEYVIQSVGGNAPESFDVWFQKTQVPAEALRARLTQPEQEPVAWKDAPSKIYLQVCEESNCDQPFDSHIEISWCQDKINNSDIAYIRADTAPPQREWQGLTDEEILEVRENCHKGMAYPQDAIVGPRMMKLVEARAIEQALKEKNNG